MKTAAIFLIAGALLLGFLFFTSGIGFRKTVDIRLHDTFYILSYLQFFLFVALVLSSLFCLGGLLGTGFKSKYFLILFVVLIFSDALVVWRFYEMIKIKES